MLHAWIARKGEQFTPELLWIWEIEALLLATRSNLSAASLLLYFWLPFPRGKGLGVRLLRFQEELGT